MSVTLIKDCCGSSDCIHLLYVCISDHQCKSYFGCLDLCSCLSECVYSQWHSGQSCPWQFYWCIQAVVKLVFLLLSANEMIMTLWLAVVSEMLRTSCGWRVGLCANEVILVIIKTGCLLYSVRKSVCIWLSVDFCTNANIIVTYKDSAVCGTGIFCFLRVNWCDLQTGWCFSQLGGSAVNVRDHQSFKTKCHWAVMI